MTHDPASDPRYQRQVILAELGSDGQRRLAESRVLLAGVGGLGSPAALYLAGAGVGTIGLADDDAVDITNLHRQVLHGEEWVGRPKLESAAARLKSQNSAITVRLHPGRLTSANALDVVREYDLVIDGTDNFPARYLLNDACVFLGKPNIYGAIQQFEGQASVFAPSMGGPCYRCLFPEPPEPGLVPSCAEAGVLGVLPGIVGMIQATEAVKLIIGQGETLVGRLLLYDALAMTFREVAVSRQTSCPVCGDNPSITKLVDYEQFCGTRSRPMQAFGTMTVDELRERREGGSDIVLVDVRNQDEWDAAHFPEARLIPLPQFQARLSDLGEFKDRDIVLHCRLGGRSAKACEALAAAGFSRVFNLAGGMEAWQGRFGNPE